MSMYITLQIEHYKRAKKNEEGKKCSRNALKLMTHRFSFLTVFLLEKPNLSLSKNKYTTEKKEELVVSH